MKATETNLWTLCELAAGRTRFPNRIDRSSAPHVRRCLRAGVVDIDGGDLVVTPAGIAAIVANNEKYAGTHLAPLVVPGTTEEAPEEAAPTPKAEAARAQLRDYMNATTKTITDAANNQGDAMPRKTAKKPARKTAKVGTTRNGKPLAPCPKGDKRRLSDGRNAWRKMTPAQRAEFLAWMDAEGLEVQS